MEGFFNQFAAIIVFFHVIAAIVWVGGMIVIRFGVHYVLIDIEDRKLKLERTLQILKRFFNMVIPSIVLLLLTAIVMAIGLGFKGTDLYSVVILKEVIWAIMTIIFIMIYIKRNKAQKLFDDGDLDGAKAMLAPLPSWMIPVNIILGMVAIYMGITLRGF